jgi:hypothetical protein
MSDTVTVAIVAGISAAVPAMLVTVLSHLRLKTEVIQVKQDVRTVEIATNSMKDALIRAAFIAGGNEEKDRQRETAAAAAAAAAPTVPSKT